MSGYCVVVTDGARARLFSLEARPPAQGGLNLVELSDLANPEFEAQGREIWSDTKSGRNLSTGGGGAHGYDDHRERHRQELEHRFARQVAQAAAHTADTRHANHLVMVADKKMLGHLRNVMKAPGGRFDITEVAKDLTKLTPTDLYSHLAADHVLPGR